MIGARQRRGRQAALAIAAGLAFDSFYIPPPRELGSRFWQNWLVVAFTSRRAS
jgi:hypothetical protein